MAGFVMKICILLVFIISTTFSLSPLDPDQISALHSLHLKPKSEDPCSSSFLKCDTSTPFRHITSLTLSSPSSLSLSSKSLNSLAKSLTSLTLTNAHSKKLTGVFLGHFHNLTSLSVLNSSIVASGPNVILTNMKLLGEVSLSGSNLTGRMPGKWHCENVSRIDFSSNKLKGGIGEAITELGKVESLNLSSNALDGEIPSSIGDMKMLKNLSLAENSLSGSLPDEFPKGLTHLDLGSNQLNGTIPHFISRIKSLKYLNLEKNNFGGVMPFNASFIKSLDVFKIGGNSNLCYNHSTFPKKAKLGIAPCDKHGLPLSPPPAKDVDSSGDSSDDDYNSENDESDKKSTKSSHVPNKVVLGVAIGLSAVVFLILFCVLISRCCR